MGSDYEALRVGRALCVTFALTVACSDDHGEFPQTDSEELIHQGVNSSETPKPQEITVASTPHAKCAVRSSATNESMSVWADDVGLVHLWAAPTDASSTYVLECSETGTTVSRALDLSDPATFSPAKARAQPTGRTTLPALDGAMAVALSQADLVRAGYPPRPDRAAPLYKQWLELVSTPTTLIRPNLVQRPDVNFGPVSYDTDAAWSGSVLDQFPSPRKVWAVGNMYVPSCVNPPGITSSRVAFWAGLDGDATFDVIQEGFMYENVGGIGQYMAWYEYLPLAPAFISNMVLHVSDSLTFWAWEGDANCTAGYAHNGYGCFWYKNNTTNVTAGTFAVPRPNMYFTGTTGEAIAERVNGWPVSLFAFGTGMQFAIFDVNGGWHTQATDAYTLFDAVNAAGQQLMAPATFGSADSVLFTWLRAQ